LVQAVISGLTNHVTYYVWVKAVYAGLGQSGCSPTVYAMPVPPPGRPDITVYPGEEMLEAVWEAVEDAFTYEVHCGSGGGDAPSLEAAMYTVSGTGIVLPGLINGVSYTVWVRAVNTAGNSSYSTKNGTPQRASGPPEKAPGPVTVSGGDASLTLSWEQIHGIPGYRVYYAPVNNSGEALEWAEKIPAAAPLVKAEITGLDNSAVCYFWVRAWNSLGLSDFSAPVSGTPQPKPPVNYKDSKFELGTAAGEYIFAQDLPPSVFFPEGRPNTDRLSRVQETALGNLFADGAAWYIRTKLKEQVDFVFLNGGYIDNALLKGAVTVGTVTSVVRQDSRRDAFFLLTMTGTELKAFFDDAAAVTHTGRGGPTATGFFGIVSKEVNYTIQYPRPPQGTAAVSAEEAEPYYHGRIKPGTLKINGSDIEDGKTYRIGTTDYLAAGEFFTRLYTGGTGRKTTGIPFWHGAAEYIYHRGSVMPYLDGRVKIEGGVPLPAPWIPGDYVP
jgi:hypothetical protein